MTRERTACRKHHCPGHIRNPAEELAVDEISYPAESKTDGSGGNHEVRNLPGVCPEFSATPYPGNDAPDKASVKGQPACHDINDFQRMLNIVRGVVKDHIAETGADDKAENSMRIERIQEIPVERKSLFSI